VAKKFQLQRTHLVEFISLFTVFGDRIPNLATERSLMYTCKVTSREWRAIKRQSLTSDNWSPC